MTGVDLIVVGGGVMGAAAAETCARGGMSVVLLEAGEMGQGASGVNAGTLSLQIKRVALMPYALRGHADWAAAGDAVGFARTGGLTLAFTETEEALLHERMALKRDAGAPIRFLGSNELRSLEPELTHGVRAASYCAEDGHADASLTGRHWRGRLRAAGVTLREGTGVTAIRPGFTVEAGRIWRAPRLLLATGARLAETAALLGASLPIAARVNTVSVTERMPRLLAHGIGHATGLLTMKQKANGSVLIGGGWQGSGTPAEGRGRVEAGTLRPNLALAVHAVPALARARLLRSWTGFEAATPDFMPLAGPLPGHSGAWVLGAVRGGYTIGPYIGRLMGETILGRDPEMPLFDPARFSEAA